MSEIVVTGASGFIARALVSRLRQVGADVLGVARSEAGPGIVRVSDYATTPVGRVLVHLAEASDRGAAERAGAEAEERSVRQVASLLEKPYAHVVYGSSAVLYGDVGFDAHRADDPVRVVDAYTRVKHRCEALVLERNGCVARLSNVYGRGMNSSSVLANIVAQLSRTGPLTIASGRPVRDFLWLDDAAAGLAAMCLRPRAGVYNLGTGLGTSIGALAEATLELAAQHARPIMETTTDGRRSHLVVDYSSTERDFGWKPAVALRDGLRQLLSDLKLVEQLKSVEQ